MFSNLGVFFEKSTDILFQDSLKNTMDNTLTKLIVQSFQNIIIKLNWTLYLEHNSGFD
jgi:hypothetical protein